MAQFDVFSLPNGSWVVDVQSDLLDIYDTRLVVPLVRPDRNAQPIRRLNPQLSVAGEHRLLAVHLASAVRRKHLSPPIASLAEYRHAIVDALDMLVAGV